MSDLRAGQVREVRDFVLLRCPEARCDRLLLKALAKGGGTTSLETVCPHCKTKALWTVQEGRRPVYQAVEKKV